MDATKSLEFLSKLTPEDQASLFQIIDQHIQESLRINGVLNRLAVDSSRSEAANRTLVDVTAKTGVSQEETLLFALTYYEVAIDAIRDGLRLVLVDKDYRLVREVTGILPETSEASSYEKVAG